MHPLQQDCDPNDPEEFAAWCWAAGCPDPRPAATMPVPIATPQLCRSLSRMLWDFGFRHHPELQTKWIEGAAGLIGFARIVDHPPEDFWKKYGQEFLEQVDPRLAEIVKNGSPADQERLAKELVGKWRTLKELAKQLGIDLDNLDKQQ
mgnify:FL=1